MKNEGLIFNAKTGDYKIIATEVKAVIDLVAFVTILSKKLKSFIKHKFSIKKLLSRHTSQNQTFSHNLQFITSQYHSKLQLPF